MRRRTPHCLAAAALLLTAAAAWAQPASTASSFQSLSPGNQKIAQALFAAQNPPANGPLPLTLDEIAALKGGEGWGQVFRQMKGEGLLTARNLGQVVSGAARAGRFAGRTGSFPAVASTVVVTTAAGRSTTFTTSTEAGGRFAAHHGARTSGVTAASAGITTAAGGAPAVAGFGHAGVVHGGGAVHGDGNAGGGLPHGGGHGR